MSVANVFTSPLLNDRGQPVFTGLIGRNEAGGIFVAVPLSGDPNALWALGTFAGVEADQLVGTLEANAPVMTNEGSWRCSLDRRRWMLPGMALAASVALGTALPNILSFLGRVLA